MERLAMETANLTDKNIDKILELFPNVATEAEDENGNLKRAIDFDKLKQELSDDIVEGEEKYDFTWVGKNKAMLEANRPIRKTLRPDRESSVDWENTQNIYIEGDNLDALKLLQESYLGKIKMIYIDPPYNTGKDFVYRDNFTQDKESYNEELGIKDEDENRLFQNTESNGRFHSDWCSMIYSRLKLAYNLLAMDGAIFVSIDDNEVRNLKNICDEVFGESNYVGLLPRLTSAQRPSQEAFFSITNDYILVYKKSFTVNFNRVIKRCLNNIKEDKNGKFIVGDTSPILASATQGYSEGGDYDVEYNGTIYSPVDGNGNRRRWLWVKERMLAAKKLGILVETKSTLRVQNYINKEFQIGTNILVDKDENLILCSNDLMDSKYTNIHGTNIINNLFGKRIFEFTKPVNLMSLLIELATNKNDIILDFFSGSATTAHACMQLNAEDGGNRKFIMVQLPEKTDEKSEAFKAGYKNICEIGEERIRRAGKKIQEENPDKKIDIGFRVFKVDDTNMKDVYYSPSETTQQNLFESNIKDDRTDEDLLYGCLLDWGVELSLPHRVEIIDGKKVHIVDNDALIACFEENIPESVIRKIAGMKPMRVVFRDSSFSNDDNKINVEEIFKLITPDTTVKVI